MTWSYTAGGTDALDRVRLIIGDTDAVDPQIPDEAITLALADCGMDVLLAAIDVIQYLRAQSAPLVTETQAGLTESWQQRQKSYADLEAMLRERLARKGMTGARMGGLSQTAKDVLLLDPDRVQPAFARERRVRPWYTYPPWNLSG